MKTKVILTLILVFVLMLTACSNKELPEDNSSEVSTPPVDNVSDYILIGEIESSNEYLKNESNNIKVYGKSQDSLGNYIGIKFVYKDNELIVDDIRIFTGLHMTREDARRYNLSEYKDMDILIITYNEKISVDEIEENILFFSQQTFSLFKPEDINISINKELVKDKVVIKNISYDLYLAKAGKIDPGIFDQKKVISCNSNIEPYIEIFALKKDDNDNYTDIHIKILGMSKIISVSEWKQFVFIGLGPRVLDINGDGNDEVIINFFERTAENEITERICFIDINTGREMDIYDLNLENIVDVTYEYDAYSRKFENESYRFYSCHYNRKEPINEDNFDPEMLKILTYSAEGNICVSVLNDPISYITENGRPDIFALQYGDKIGFYCNWSMPKCSPISEYEYSYEPFVDIGLIDVNDDGLNEIIITMYIGGGTGAVEVDLHIIDGNTLEEIVSLTNWDVGLLLRDYVDSRVYFEDLKKIEGNEVKLDININDEMNNKYSYSFDYNENITYFNFLGYASAINYVLDSDMNRLMVEVSAAIGINQFIGYFEAKITLVDNNVNFSDIQFIINE
jgi:hypothetical protein